MGASAIDAIELAKDVQWVIETIEDPALAAIKASRAVTDIEHLQADALREGQPIIVHALGAYVFRHWLEDEQRFVSLRSDEICATGESLGLSFVQNMSNPHIQTLFVGLRNTNIVEVERHNGEQDVVSPLASPNLVVPILDITSVMLAA